MLELFVVALFAAVVVAGVLFLGFLAVIARFLGWLLVLPFQILGWLLGGLGFVIALPFVIVALAIGAVGVGVGVLVLFTPLVPLALLAVLIAWLVRRGRRTTVAG